VARMGAGFIQDEEGNILRIIVTEPILGLSEELIS